MILDLSDLHALTRRGAFTVNCRTPADAKAFAKRLRYYGKKQKQEFTIKILGNVVSVKQGSPPPRGRAPSNPQKTR